jgi:hypothetical protein
MFHKTSFLIIKLTKIWPKMFVTPGVFEGVLLFFMEITGFEHILKQHCVGSTFVSDKYPCDVQLKQGANSRMLKPNHT